MRLPSHYQQRARRGTEEREILEFPRGWPAIFKESAALRTLVNKKLRGTRCRAVDPPAEVDKKAARALSFETAQFPFVLAPRETVGVRSRNGSGLLIGRRT